MGDTLVLAESAHGIHLILHKGDKRGNHYRHPLHEEGGQLIAKAFASARRHQHESIPARKYVAYDRFLISLKRSKTEILLQFLVQHVMQIVHLPLFFLLPYISGAG